MSYILEALKRAEEQRGASPRAVPAPRPLPDRLSRPRWWWIASGALGAAVLGAFAFWIMTPASPTVGGPTVVGSPTPVAVAPALPAEPAPRIEPLPPRPESASPVARPPRVERVEPLPPRTTPSARTESAPRVDPAPPLRQAPPPPSTAPPAPRSAPPPAETARAGSPPTPPSPAAPPAMAGDIKALTAKLSLQVLSWAPDAKDRFVFVNGRKYREGQTIDDKLLVERIAEDSVVLSFQGQRVTLRSP